ncbi:uncharacterized protein LOC141631272 [Silene latifolia]|uniref:uncharacterized protein LOC141631272 n=1 Tax=Silene latifolia TaxID=37657 RepID=UPI003D77CA4A
MKEIDGFKHHPLCKKMNLTHLCFADDLLVFCRGDWESMIVIIRAFNTFSAASGLKMNKQKSNVYGNGMPREILEKFALVSGLKIAYCGSYQSSRSQKIVICREIGDDQENFLWKGEAMSQSPALVAWDRVCLPKTQGGLGVCDLRRWNIVVVGKYVSWIMNKKDHLWVKWVHSIYIKDVPWHDYKPSQGSSWAWKRICRIKDRLLAGYVNNGWITEDGEYTIAKGYHWLGTAAPAVVWYNCIWNSIHVPKHQFIGWLWIQGRLLTKDRLCSMGISSNTQCELCADAAESHEQLFLGCEYS